MTEQNHPETYGDYSVDDEDQLQPEDALDQDYEDRDVDDKLDRGYTAPEDYSAGQGYGNTPYEEAQGETLDQRLRQEVEEPDPYAEVEAENADPDVPPEVARENLDDGEVGGDRAGRLVAPDLGTEEDAERDLVGEDIGIDGAAASAEEAAVHVVEEEYIDVDSPPR